MNCWEYMDCSPEVRRNCPAYPKNGRDCWKMQSTLCAGGRYMLSDLQEKISFCRRCEFYKLHARRQAPNPQPVQEKLEDSISEQSPNPEK